jgi:NAD(P)-dependent dehydrogenase (short-subunit alcohol dehydrogenase family)
MKKTVLITGATSGIGKDAAIYLTERGHRVLAAGRNERALAELRGLGLETIRLDVTDKSSIAHARAEVDRLTNGEGLDVLVNNAGYGLMGPLEMLSDEDVRAQFETNVFGVLALTQTFLPDMRKKGWGRIINVSSVGGRMVFPLGGAYHATKYALEAMSDALRMEVRQFGIEVVVVEPGYIKTGFTGTSVDLLGKYNTPDSPYAASFALADGAESKLERFAVGPRSVSKAIERGIVRRRPAARYVAPWINSFGPWMRSWMPTRLLDWVFRRATGLTRALPAQRPALTSGA